MKLLIMALLVVGCMLLLIDQIMYKSTSVVELSIVGSIGFYSFILGLFIYPVFILIGLLKRPVK